MRVLFVVTHLNEFVHLRNIDKIWMKEMNKTGTGVCYFLLQKSSLTSISHSNLHHLFIFKYKNYDFIKLHCSHRVKKYIIHHSETLDIRGISNNANRHSVHVHSRWHRPWGHAVDDCSNVGYTWPPRCALYSHYTRHVRYVRNTCLSVVTTTTSTLVSVGRAITPSFSKLGVPSSVESKRKRP